MRVALASGLGVEGTSMLKYYQAKGDQVVIFDTRGAEDVTVPDGVECVLGPDAFSKIVDFDLVLRSPSVRPDALPSNIPIWTSTNEFFKKCPAPIIGVTGTKGKGTTCTLIAKILEAAGKTVHLVGNIGKPALDELPNIAAEDIVIFELSSFQLWDIEASPHAAVLLLISEDHLDVHTDMDEYVEAKANITKFQTSNDVLVHHPNNTYVQSIVASSAAEKIPYLQPPGAEVTDGQIVIAGQVICAVNEVGLLGKHNLENVCAAITATWQYSQDVAALKRAVTEFAGLPYHLERVAEVDGVTYYNDAFATAVPAAVVATQAIKTPRIMIYGGFDRNNDVAAIAQVAADEGIRKALLIGQTARKIAKAMDSAGFTAYEVLDQASLLEVLARARELAHNGDSVIFSPGCPSFDMFKDYKDRGQQFSAAVQLLDSGSFIPPYNQFYFDGYDISADDGRVSFHYSYQDGPSFTEVIDFGKAIPEPASPVLTQALQLVHLILGISYYKLYLAPKLVVKSAEISIDQAKTLNEIYHHGLGEFLFMNKLTESMVGNFEVSGKEAAEPGEWKGKDSLLMLSGGKDSTLAASLLKSDWKGWHLANSEAYPKLLKDIDPNLHLVTRTIDKPAITTELAKQALNGHVPFSAILASIGVALAVLDGRQNILCVNEWSANEPTATLADGTPVNHQYSKSYDFELMFNEYLQKHVAKGLRYGSVLRPFSELRISELFVEHCWKEYGHKFASCNRANYKQGQENEILTWCADCPKCANAFLLLMPFVEYDELIDLFGSNLLTKPSLQLTFRQLLGLEDEKPFECVGEVEEMRLAYQLGQDRDARYYLDFDVPHSTYDYKAKHDHQAWLDSLIDYSTL